MRKILIILLVPFLVFSQNYSESFLDENIFTVFYNVENLFDTINNINTNDDEFLPSSQKKWNTKRYFHKINQLSKVFSSIAQNINHNKIPDLIGLCEVENDQVIYDLLKTPIFRDYDFTIIHKDSPDGRGIDCALLFNSRFKLLRHDFIQIDIPNEIKSTRDIVFAKLKLNNIVINIFVNHWPSRWGGQLETNYKRVFVANTLRNFFDLNTSKNEYSIIMGDFNDYPNNESLSHFLVHDDLINLMTTDFVFGKGSYNYKGSWNWLDQIIVSQNFLDSNIEKYSSGAFNEDFMLYTNKKGEVYPNRTFGGNNWYGGFSDHLPVYFLFRFYSN